MHQMPTRIVPCNLILTETQFYCRLLKRLLNLSLPGYAKTSSDIYNLTLAGPGGEHLFTLLDNELLNLLKLEADVHF